MGIIITLVGLSVLYACLLVRYLRIAYVDELRFWPYEYPGDPDSEAFMRSTRAKLSLSVLFCIVATAGLLYHIALGRFSGFSTFVLAGLICAVFGDYYLQFIRADAKKFNAGILFFALTQVLLLAYLFSVSAIGWTEIIISVVILILILLLMKKQDWKLGKAQGPLTVYTVLLVLMTVKSVVVACSVETSDVSAWLFAVGAVLFLLSDLLLGIWNFHSNHRIHAYWNWITYFSGTLLIALSLGVGL
ncbi:MAG: lysoplasmalogenase family protein [Christensenella sp.]|nr:lysoplasmalogenase family protein [Christensenella sp.]